MPRVAKIGVPKPVWSGKLLHDTAETLGYGLEVVFTRVAGTWSYKVTSPTGEIEVKSGYTGKKQAQEAAHRTVGRMRGI